jgi:hypothetical protein
VGSLVVDSLRSRRGYPYTGTLAKGSSLCVPLLESSFFFCLFGQPDPALSHFQHERLVARIVRALPRSAADRQAFGEAGEYLGLQSRERMLTAGQIRNSPRLSDCEAVIRSRIKERLRQGMRKRVLTLGTLRRRRCIDFSAILCCISRSIEHAVSICQFLGPQRKFEMTIECLQIVVGADSASNPPL